MRRFTAAVLLLLSCVVASAQKQITIEEIYSGAFRTRGMERLQSMPASNHYTVVQSDRASRSQQIDAYDFRTLEKVATLFDTKKHRQISAIDTYAFDAQEKQILIGTNSTAIYRRSFLADYYLYNVNNGLFSKVLDQVQEPLFSPDGTKIAYAKDNDLWYYDIAADSHTRITSDGSKNEIINGITDWVYEEEFAFVRAFDWSADSKHIGFIRFDETRVPEFSMTVYGSALYSSQYDFKYPKAGEKNAIVSVHLYDLKAATLKKAQLPLTDESYVARLQFTKNPGELSVQVLNRHQNDLGLYFINVNSGASKLILRETDEAYVDVTDDLTFLADNSFVWSSERSGFNHFYLYDANGKFKRALTKGNFDVTRLYGVDEKGQKLYFQSVENGPLYRDIYVTGLNSKNKKRLTSAKGTHVATFSPDFSVFVRTFSNSQTPPSYALCESATGREIKPISDNAALLEKLAPYQLPKKEFFTITTPAGVSLNAWMIKPADFDAAKKYPVFMYQYSGPGSQEVADSWNDANDYWFMSLAQQGYITVCVDPRGTGYRGAAFKKVTQNELGKYEVEDQIASARIIGNYPYVDASRIGIFGWSYGGFMSANCLLKGNDVFKMAIAVAPVTSWRFYDTIYTERYMKTPQENPSGYDENSPLHHVDKLKGKFLLVHGTADDNVHVHNTMQMVEALVQANKPFEWAIYPDKNHGIYGGKTRVHLYEKMTQFVLDNL